MINELALNPTRSIYSVFGNICNDPNFLKNPEVVLASRDFVQQFHKIVFIALNNLAYSDIDVNNITPIDVDNYLSSYPVYYKIWEENDGVRYIDDAKNHANGQIFHNDYERLKKFSLLRNYVEEGIDVSDIYDYKSNDLKDLNESSHKLEDMSSSDIIEHYTQKTSKIREDWNVEAGVVLDFKAGDDLDTLLERIQKEPDLGYPFQNGYYNKLFRGMRKGKFMLRSGSTGTGKTRAAIKDVCTVACKEIYVTGKGWISLGPACPALFISTELDKEEVQLIMLAFITGISDSVIKDGNYDAGTALRLKKGLEVIKEAPLFASYIEDFSISDIEMKIEQYIIKENVEYVAFDYIQMVPKLSKTMQQNFGQNLREDQILVHFSAALKNIATRYNIFLESSTQLNRSSKDIENRDATSLRGSMATADKIDYGVLLFGVTAQDKTNLKHILSKGFANKKEPNFSHWIYKNRAGLKNVVLWTHMDLGTMREELLFATDYEYNLIEDIVPLEINFIGDDGNVIKDTHKPATMQTIQDQLEEIPSF